MTAPLLKIEHLEVRYGDLIGVSDVSLEVPEGSVVALLGSNGGGKTTTLNAIAGLIPVHSGSIAFRGEEIGRRECVFDRAQGAGAVAGRLAAVRAAKRREQSQARARRRCATRRAPRRCSSGSTRSFRNSPSGAASAPAPCPAASGRCWRSAARLMSDPKLLMLDEPSLGLAPAVVESMYETFGRLHREGLTILLAEQSIELALEVSDFATVLQVGKKRVVRHRGRSRRRSAGAEGLSRHRVRCSDIMMVAASRRAKSERRINRRRNDREVDA